MSCSRFRFEKKYYLWSRVLGGYVPKPPCKLRLCTHNRFNGPLSGTTRVGRYQKKHSPTHTHPVRAVPLWQLSFLLLYTDSLYQLPPSTTIYSILRVQFTCLTVLFHNFCPGSLSSSSWSGALHFILHAFLHPVIICFSQHVPIPSQLQCWWVVEKYN